MGYEWLALCAALLWAISSLISVTPARHLGTFAYSRWRMASVSIMLGTAALFTGGWITLSFHHILLMSLSGLIGIFIGDTALFSCFNRIGPRRASLLFSCHSVFSVLLGFMLFSESLVGLRLLGAIMVFSGVLIAVFFGQKKQVHQWEKVRGSIWIAVGLGLLAAFCQSIGAIIAMPVMTASVDPIAGSAVRMIAAFVAHFGLLFSGWHHARALQSINWRIFGYVVLNGFLAMGVGMTLIMTALKYGDVGMVGLLSSTTPIMVLPLLWCFTRQCPAWQAWLGALSAVIGTTLITIS